MTVERKLWSELPKAEARAVFDAYVEGYPARLVAFFEDVRRRRGPVDQLDFGRDSLVTIWSWFEHVAPVPVTPVTHEAMVAWGPLPWWYSFHYPLGWAIGAEASHMVTLLAAYFAEV